MIFLAWMYEGYNDSAWPNAFNVGPPHDRQYHAERILNPFADASRIWTSANPEYNDTVLCRYVIGWCFNLPLFQTQDTLVVHVLPYLLQGGGDMGKIKITVLAQVSHPSFKSPHVL